MSECGFLNPLRRDGTSQRQRLLEPLAPSHVRVDGRKTAELLLYVRRYAELLRYYSPNNRAAGDWREFIDHDVSTVVSVIGAKDTDQMRESFDLKKRKALEGGGPWDPAGFSDLLQCIAEVAAFFDGWYRDSVEGLALRSALERLIRSVLNDALRTAIAYAEGARAAGLDVGSIDSADFSPIWSLADVEPDLSILPSGPAAGVDEIESAVTRASTIFDRFFESLVAVVTQADDYLGQTLTNHAAHEPQMALLLTFLLLFKHAQSHLNTLTAKHLDFYYREVLGLEHRAAQADLVHLVVELAKGFSSHKLEEDTYLKAGKDSAGVELLYASDEELVANRAKLDASHGLKTIYIGKNKGDVERIYAATDADSGDGKGAGIEDAEGKWETFGGTGMPWAGIGFAIASPMFRLSEGDRRIKLDFWMRLPKGRTLAGERKKSFALDLRKSLDVFASGEKEWLRLAVEKAEVNTSVSTSPTLTLELSLAAGEDPIVAYDDEVLTDGFTTRHPMVKLIFRSEALSSRSLSAAGVVAEELEAIMDGKILEFSDRVKEHRAGSVVRLENELFLARKRIPQGILPTSRSGLWTKLATAYPYRYFEGAELLKLDVSAQVGGFGRAALQGARDLILENDVGVLDPAKPFHPFGPVPRNGSSFLVGSPEIFSKAVEELRLEIEWADLPQESFTDHYKGYALKPRREVQSLDLVTSNQYFKADFTTLKDGTWQPLTGDKQDLFTGSKAPDAARAVSLSPALSRAPDLEAFERFDTSLRQGFVRATLEQSFLHDMYPRLLAEAATPPAGAIPNQPYTPLMASIALHYKASETIDYTRESKATFAKRVENIFQIWPFGHREVFPIADDAKAVGVPIDRELVPDFTITVKEDDGSEKSGSAEGSLLIGLDGLKPPQNLSLLFQVAEGSEENPEGATPTVVWSYLAANQEWADFKSAEVLADGTNGLLTSGVVKLATPKEMTASTTVLPKGLHWIKASVLEDTKSMPKLIAVYPQAVVASFRDQKNDPGHLAQPLAAATISKLKSRAAAVKSITQPYASFGGRMKESDDSFYTRVSERLRHRGRAVTVFDYERLVLERFPEVYKVRCINHTRSKSSDLATDAARSAREYAPGYVKLVVVPNLRNKNAVDPLRPRLSRNKLDSIRRYLEEFSSDFVTLEVANPAYEEVEVRFNVRLERGRDKGLYETELVADIIGFLSPWLHDDAADLTFGGRIHRSAILNYVEEREYVDFITDFRMDHIDSDGFRKRDVEEAEASSSSAALVSAKAHTVGFDVVSCVDSLV